MQQEIFIDGKLIGKKNKKKPPYVPNPIYMHNLEYGVGIRPNQIKKIVIFRSILNLIFILILVVIMFMINL